MVTNWSRAFARARDLDMRHRKVNDVVLDILLFMPWNLWEIPKYKQIFIVCLDQIVAIVDKSHRNKTLLLTLAYSVISQKLFRNLIPEIVFAKKNTHIRNAEYRTQNMATESKTMPPSKIASTKARKKNVFAL